MPARYYQVDAVNAVWNFFETHDDGHPLIALPTGTGKGMVNSMIIERALWEFPATRIMCLTHVKKLIDQNHKKLIERWPSAPAGIYSAGMNRRDFLQQVIFGGIASVIECMDLFAVPDLIIIDEAHLVSPDAETMYVKFISYMMKKNPKLKVIGLSATCYRMGLGSLTNGKLFTHICFDYTTQEKFQELLEEGYMAPLYAEPTQCRLSTQGVQMGANGDYNLKQLQKAVDDDEITRRALQETVAKYGDRKRWLIFGAGVHHVQSIERILGELGRECVTIHSKNKDKVNDANMALFESGTINIAVSMNSLTTGVDVPDIDLIVVLRPTKSTPLWVQMLGRGTRPVFAPGFDLSTKEGRFAAMAAGPKPLGCLVLDFAGNTRELGPINNPRLPRKPDGKKKTPQAPVVKECPKCKTYVAPSTRVCTRLVALNQECGYVFPHHIDIQDYTEGLPVMTMEAPKVERFYIENLAYGVQHRRNAVPVFKAVYTARSADGVLRMFTEWLGFESGGSTQKRAQRWWIERTHADAEIPTTCIQARDWNHKLRIPRWMLVWVNKPSPEIMSYEYEQIARAA